MLYTVLALDAKAADGAHLDDQRLGRVAHIGRFLHGGHEGKLSQYI